MRAYFGRGGARGRHLDGREGLARAHFADAHLLFQHGRKALAQQLLDDGQLGLAILWFGRGRSKACMR